MKIFKIFAICIVFIAACTNKDNKGRDADSFYKEKGGWDAGRIPLIKPYEAIITNKNVGWGMGLEGLDGDTGFTNIKNINVIDGMILVYSVNSILHGIDTKETWHIIVPNKGIEKGFSNHQDYLNYLNKLGVTSEPNLINIDKVAKFFDKYDRVDWEAIN